MFSRVIQQKRDGRPAGDGIPLRDFDDLIDFLTGRVSLGGHPRTFAAAARADDDGLARALVTERAARKPTAEAAARQLIAENGGSPDALRW